MQTAKWLNIKSVRFGLFLSLLTLAPLSKYPSYSLPKFNYSSFRIGLYQILLGLFVLACMPRLVSSLKILYCQEKLAFISIKLLALCSLVGLLSALNLARSSLMTASILFLLLGLLSAWWYVSFELDKNRYKQIVVFMLVAGILFSLLSIIQFVLAGFGHSALLLCKNCGDQIFGFPRVNGFAAEPQFHANAMLVYFFISLGAYYMSRSKLALSGLALSLVSIGLTFSRGAYLALFVGIIIFYILLRMQGGLRIRTLILHTMVFMVTVVITFILIIGAASYKYRGTSDITYKTISSLTEQVSLGLIRLPEKKSPGFEPAGLIEASANERLDAAKLGLRAWGDNLKNKVLGVGSGNLGPYVNTHIDSGAPSDLTIYIFYVLVLVELGILGLASTLGLFIGSLSGFIGRFWRHKDPAIYTALFSLGTAFLLQFLFFGSYINITYIWLFFGIILGLGRTNKQAAYNINKRK